MFTLPAPLRYVASQILLKVLCTRKKWLLDYKSPPLKKQLVLQPHFQLGVCFLTDTEHWALDRSPWSFHRLFKPKMSTQLPPHIMCFPTNVDMTVLLLKLFLLRNFQFPFWKSPTTAEAIFVLVSEKREYFWRCPFPFPELGFRSSLSSPLPSAVTPPPRSKG